MYTPSEESLFTIISLQTWDMEDDGIEESDLWESFIMNKRMYREDDIIF